MGKQQCIGKPFSGKRVFNVNGIAPLSKTSVIGTTCKLMLQEPPVQNFPVFVDFNFHPECCIKAYSCSTCITVLCAYTHFHRCLCCKTVKREIACPFLYFTPILEEKIASHSSLECYQVARAGDQELGLLDSVSDSATDSLCDLGEVIASLPQFSCLEEEDIFQDTYPTAFILLGQYFLCETKSYMWSFQQLKLLHRRVRMRP